jgi:hypothetical protein
MKKQPRPVLIIKIKRGPALFDRERTPLRYGEWVWLTDTKQLATGDGVNPEPLIGHYHGGLLTMLFDAPSVPWTMVPLSVPLEVLNTLVLEEGEVVYCPECDWLYVGDGKTKGGIRAG